MNKIRLERSIDCLLSLLDIRVLIKPAYLSILAKVNLFYYT
jgi:hypothetical protein